MNELEKTAEEFRLEAEAAGLHVAQAAAQGDVDQWNARASDLQGQISRKRQAIQNALSYRYGALASLDKFSAAVNDRLSALGDSVVKGTDEGNAKRSISGISRGNDNVIGDAKKACNDLISRLQRDLGDLNGQLSDAQNNAAAAVKRRDGIGNQISADASKLRKLQRASS
ncbi:hypothetical protein OZX72_06845 [Bifidobacterium sp. ESL0769]|uniref:hypothetical protein n=1 Tax=Bifidobacterium sp. ESL0769 TaxID=2983229 RepID=UPI0023F689A5|nr:hypothetical protein [Bifidobacterium sp. ESL0769]WEV66964.1 hypothetical protein OZX72_06845 [Bifidobacterium sp. ESL0769]